MKIEQVPFCTMDWNQEETTEHPGITGTAYWKTFEMGSMSYQVAEDADPHRSHTETGAKLFIVD